MLRVARPIPIRAITFKTNGRNGRKIVGGGRLGVWKLGIWGWGKNSELQASWSWKSKEVGGGRGHRKKNQFWFGSENFQLPAIHDFKWSSPYHYVIPHFPFGWENHSGNRDKIQYVKSTMYNVTSHLVVLPWGFLDCWEILREEWGIDLKGRSIFNVPFLAMLNIQLKGYYPAFCENMSSKCTGHD